MMATEPVGALTSTQQEPMSSLSSSSSVSSNCQMRNGKKRTKAGLKSTIIGKTQYQVERRNARERRRVQAVNQGYEDLAKQISEWEELKNKKLTKSETLKAAILYIQHLEDLLSTPAASSASNSPPTMQSTSLIKSEQFVDAGHPIKNESPIYDHHSQQRQFHAIQAQNCVPSQQNYSPPIYVPYFNAMPSNPMQINCQAEYGNENHLLTHYDFNTGRYS